MPEHDNDRLEQFFRKAASKPDVSFNEDDWKKLEARLEAEADGMPVAERAVSKIATVVVLCVVLLFSGGIWVNSQYGLVSFSEPEEISRLPGTEDGRAVTLDRQTEVPENREGPGDSESVSADSEPVEGSGDGTQTVSGEDQSPLLPPDRSAQIALTESNTRAGRSNIDIFSDEDNVRSNDVSSMKPLYGVDDRRDAVLSRDLIQISSALAERNKQKAVVELPGAEEGETGEVEAVVPGAQASDREPVATPRLSLLLSFAPDFSSTSINRYSAPGRAFGAMVQYHINTRWTVSTGVIKNKKQYTGAGEDYTPPVGYWEYYTNGKIPNSIDGSCSILEFPVMVQYTLFQNGRNRWSAGGGVSSYLMLNESYRYFFDEPNPGAKEGWESRNRSRFLFNMVNLAVGYEHRIVPGLMIGIEPYVKIPVEEIGWTNIKLFSTGAFLTLRFVVAQKRDLSVPSRSRGPD